MPQRPIQARDAVAAAKALGIIIRSARPGEIPAIVDVINRAYRPRDWHIFQQLRTSVDSYPVELEGRRSTGLVAELGGSVVAHVCLRIEPPKAEFGLLATLPEFQRRGIAAIMIATCEQRAADVGCDVMALDAVEEVGMRPYYESLGYVLERSEAHSMDWNAKVPWTHIFMTKALV
jgi:predicted N-acetyltransferase YhbS